MRKIVIPILSLLLLPTMTLAADELSFDADTNLTVGGFTLSILNGATVDSMEVGASTVTFTLSANSTLIIRSTAKANLTDSLGIGFSCGGTYSEFTTSGAGSGSSLTITPSGVCIGSSGGGSSGGGGGGGGSPTPSTPSVPTSTTGEVTATASGGGKTTLSTDENTTAAVKLPANAVSASTVVKITSEAKDTVTDTRSLPSARSVVGGYIYDYTATAGGATVSAFDKTVTLTFTYTDDQIGDLDESTFKVFYWKESASQWVALATTVDADNNSLTAETNHFTYFAVLGTTTEEGAEEELEEETPAPADEGVVINDGDIVKNPNASGLAQFDIYIVKFIGSKKFKRLILSPHVFESYEHLNWGDVKDVSQSVMDEHTTSDLVRAINGTKVYKLTPAGDTGAKQWLNMTASDFAAQGYDADSIYTINDTDRDAYSTGSEITVGNAVGGETIVIKVSSLRVRSLPSLDGEVLTQVYEGEVYDLLDEQNSWYKITANGITGWCYGGDTGGYAAKQ